MADFSYTPPGRNHLHVPGPVNIHERVIKAMQMPGQNHREPWFPILFKKLIEEVKMLFNTANGTTFIFSGTGTGGWESALTNTLSPGDHVVAFRYGTFSLLWVDMMERMGLKVTVFDERWGNGADEEKIEQVKIQNVLRSISF